MGSERKFYLINLVGMTGISIEQLDAISCCSGTSAQLCVWQPLDEESCVTAPVLSWTVTMARLGESGPLRWDLKQTIMHVQKELLLIFWLSLVVRCGGYDDQCWLLLFSVLIFLYSCSASLYILWLCMKFWVFLRQDITVRFGWGGTADSLVRLDQEWGTELLRQGKVRICTNFKCLSDAMAARERSS